MDVAEVLPFHLELELPEGLNKRHALNVSDCTSQLLEKRRVKHQTHALNTCLSTLWKRH